jgi:RsiW-degrading membrane proteinase PrsW (M82 family)
MINIIISLTPSLLYLFCLRLLDSYNLVKLKTVIMLLVYGFIAALLAYILNVNLIVTLGVEGKHYSKYVAPVVEEILKASFIIFFLLRKRTAFLVDSAIFGFSIGAGFAFIENIYYLNSISEANILIWILRGFGTAIMHGCTTAIYSLIVKYFSDRFQKNYAVMVLLLLIVPIIIHMAFNGFIVSPVIFTLIQLTVTPILFYIVFIFSENQVKDWLELSLESNLELLRSINEGKLLESKIGSYLQNLKSKFSSLILADLLCYIRLYVELSMNAKGLLIMKEIGFSGNIIKDLKEKITEIKYLEQKIGFTGRLAIQPIIYNEKGIVWIEDLLAKCIGSA